MLVLVKNFVNEEESDDEEVEEVEEKDTDFDVEGKDEMDDRSEELDLVNALQGVRQETEDGIHEGDSSWSHTSRLRRFMGTKAETSHISLNKYFDRCRRAKKALVTCLASPSRR